MFFGGKSTTQRERGGENQHHPKGGREKHLHPKKEEEGPERRGDLLPPLLLLGGGAVSLRLLWVVLPSSAPCSERKEKTLQCIPSTSPNDGGSLLFLPSSSVSGGSPPPSSFGCGLPSLPSLRLGVRPFLLFGRGFATSSLPGREFTLLPSMVVRPPSIRRSLRLWVG